MPSHRVLLLRTLLLLVLGLVVVVAVPGAAANKTDGASKDAGCSVDVDSLTVEGPHKMETEPMDSVSFRVSMKWAPFLKMKMKVVHENSTHSEDSYAPHDGECGQLVSRTFNVFSVKPRMMAYVSMGTKDAASQDGCLNLLCQRFQLYDVSLTNESQVQLSHFPEHIRAGEPGTVECSSLDRNRITESLVIRILDYKTGMPVLVVDSDKLAMEFAMPGRYECALMGAAPEDDQVSSRTLTIEPLDGDTALRGKRDIHDMAAKVRDKLKRLTTAEPTTTKATDASPFTSPSVMTVCVLAACACALPSAF